MKPSRPPSEANAQSPETLVGLRTREPVRVAAGIPAIVQTMKHVMGQDRVVKGTRLLLKVNQANGFDCPGCAWPDPDGHRSIVEFCENGAKAAAEEGTAERVTPEFFREHSVAELSIVAINPLHETGLLAFKHPQELLHLLGKGTQLASLFLQVRINGDVPLLQGVAKELLEMRAIDRDFVDADTAGFAEYEANLEKMNWDDIVEESGISRDQIVAGLTGQENVIAAPAGDIVEGTLVKVVPTAVATQGK